MRRAILLFVKFPEPGRVKTRLAATVGAERAAEIYRRLVVAVLGSLPREHELVVAFDPPEKRAEVVAWLGAVPGGRRAHFLPQAGGDLGARLERAFAETFALGFENVAVIGSDCIELTPATFSAAWQALATHDAVLGPSTDGGYYLLALRRPCAALFRGIAWSTGAVRAQTLAQAHAAGLRVHELGALPDIDTEADWRRAEAKVGS
jgi:rSAM/selenodomain-associated transferase 1